MASEVHRDHGLETSGSDDESDHAGAPEGVVANYEQRSGWRWDRRQQKHRQRKPERQQLLDQYRREQQHQQYQQPQQPLHRQRPQQAKQGRPLPRSAGWPGVEGGIGWVISPEGIR